MQEDHEDAWKKLLVVAFVAIIVAAVSLQVSQDLIGFDKDSE